MKATAGFLGIVLALGTALYLYNAQLTRGSANMASPQEQIDVTGIQMALREIAQAERNYVAAHGAYGTFEQLRAEGGSPALGTDRRGYTFELQLKGSEAFTATATPTDSKKQGWPTLSIDASMQIAER